MITQISKKHIITSFIALFFAIAIMVVYSNCKINFISQDDKIEDYYYQEKVSNIVSSNKKQDFDIKFVPRGFELNSSKNADAYNVKYYLKGIDVNGHKMSLNSSPKFIADKNKMSEIQSDQLSVNYTNTETGLRQDFVINDGPVKNVSFKVNLELTTNLKPYRINDFSIGMKSISNDAVNVKYKDLLVYDANGKMLTCKMEFEQMEDGLYSIDLIASADEVKYPVTIDPLSTSNTGFESGLDSTYTGYAVASCDVNNDGYSDAMVSSYGFTKSMIKQVGKVDVFYGSASGIDMTAPDFTIEGDTLIKKPGFKGLNVGPQFGFSLDCAHDVNGDTYDDVIIGAPATSMIDTTGGGSDTINEAGAFYIYYGSATGLTIANADTIYGSVDTMTFGYKVAGLGSINGDGFADVMVSAPGFLEDTGAVFVYLGSAAGLNPIPTKVLRGTGSREMYGTALAGPGDVNGDGMADMLIGAHNYTFNMGARRDTAAGRARLFLGSVGPISTVPAWQYIGPHKNAHFGFSVSGAGNFDGIGNKDVIIGANQFNPNYITTMPDTITCLTSDTSSMVMYNCYGKGKGIGAVYVFSGSVGGLGATETSIILNDVGESGFGSAVSEAGDVDSDGKADIIVGAPFYSKNALTDQGAVYGYYGKNFLAVKDTTFDWCSLGERRKAFLGGALDKFGKSGAALDTAGVLLGAYGFNGTLPANQDSLYRGAAFLYKEGNCGLVKYKQPVFLTFPPDTIVVDAGFGICGANVRFDYPQIGTNCPATLTIITGIDSSGLFPIGSNTVTFRIVSDGQTVDSSFVIVVEDNQSPMPATCPEAVVQQLPTGSTETPITWTDPTFTDNHGCSGGSMTITQISGVTKNSTQGVGIYPIVFEARDSSGNIGYCTFRVIISKTSTDGRDCSFKTIASNVDVPQSTNAESNIEVGKHLNEFLNLNNGNFGVSLLISLFEGASGIALPSWIKAALGEAGTSVNLVFVKLTFSFLPSLDMEFGAYYKIKEATPLKLNVNYAGDVCSIKPPDKLYGCRDTINFATSFMVDPNPANTFLNVTPGQLNQVMGVFLRNFIFKWEIYVKVSACIGIPLCVPIVGPCAGCLGYTASYESPHVNVFSPIRLLEGPNAINLDLISVCDESFQQGASIFTVLNCLGAGGGADTFVKELLGWLPIGPDNLIVDPFFYDKPNDEFVFNPNRLPKVGNRIPEMQLRFGRLTNGETQTDPGFPARVLPKEMGPTFVNGTALTTSGKEKSLISATLDIFSLLYYALPPAKQQALACAGIDIGTRTIDIGPPKITPATPSKPAQCEVAFYSKRLSIDVLDINIILRSEYNVNYSFDPKITVDSMDLGVPSYWSRPNALPPSSGTSRYVEGVGMDENIKIVVPDGQTEPYFIGNTFKADGKFIGQETKTQKIDVGFNVLEFLPSLWIPSGFGPILPLGPYNILSLGTKRVRDIDRTIAIPKFSATVTMTPDDIPPVIFCNDTTVYLSPDGFAYLDAETAFNRALSYDLPIGGSGMLNVIDVFPDTIFCDDYPSTTGYLVIEDDNCNFDTCEFVVTVLDTIRPQMGCVDIIVGIGENGTYILNPDEIAIGVTDNCRNLVVTANPDTFFCDDVMIPQLVTVYVTDIAGNTNSCTVDVTVVDTMDLLLVCPYLYNYPVHRDTRQGFCDYIAGPTEFRPTLIAPDCGTEITYILTGATTGSGLHNVNGVRFNLGATTIEYTATDDSGNTTVCSFILIIEDHEAPLITCPMSVTIGTNYDLANNYDCATNYLWSHPTPLDNCSSITSYMVTYTNPDGTTQTENLRSRLLAGNLSQLRNFALGITTIEYFATDTMQNSVSCIFTVNVIDDELPTLFCQNVIACQDYLYEDSEDILPNATTTFTLSVPNNINISDVNVSLKGTALNLGQLSFVLISPSGTSVPLFASLCNNTTTFNLSLDDAAALSVNAAPCNPLGGGGIYRPTSLLAAFNGQSALGNWRLLVTNTNNVSCGSLETFSINICGNSVDMMMITKVSVLTNDNECEFVVLNKNLDPAFTDNCAGALLTHNYIFGPFDNTLQGAVLPLGETTVVWTATDAAGNVRTCTIIYEVKDKNKPEFINCPDPDYIQDAEPGICGAYVNFSLPIAFDACDGQLEVRQVDNTGLFTGSVFPVGMSILIFEASDASGNTSRCTVRVIVNDTQNGSFACPANVTVSNDVWLCTAVVNGIFPKSITDNCIANQSISYQIESPANSGIIVGGGVEDASGNVFNKGTSSVKYRMASQPLLLITEVSQDIGAPVGGMNPIPYIVISGNDYLELTNFGPAAYNISGLIIERFGPGFNDVFEVPNLTILQPGATLVLHYGNGVDVPASHFYNVKCATNLTTGQQAGYAISFKGRPIDVVTTNGMLATGFPTRAIISAADWLGTTGNSSGRAGIIRKFSFDNNTGTDWKLAEDCDPITIGQINPGLDVYAWNGTTTALQSIPPAINMCTFTVTVIDAEAPFCGEVVGTTTYTGAGISGNSTSCNLSNISVNSSCILSDVKVVVHGQVFGTDSIILSLQSPSGKEVILMNKICAGNPDVTKTLNVTFDKSALQAVNASCGSSTIQGSYRPLGGDLFNFYGEKSQGTWVLKAYAIPGSSSTINITDWQLVTTCTSSFVMDDVVLNNDLGQCGASYSWIHPLFLDNCQTGTIAVEYITQDADCVPSGGLLDSVGGQYVTKFFCTGTTTVRYILTDIAGNVNECSFDVTVIDNERAIIDPVYCQDITIGLEAGECNKVLYFNEDVSTIGTDNCGIASVSYNPPSGTSFEIGTTNVIITVTDNAGNTSTCDFDVTIIEYGVLNNTITCNNSINISLGPDCTAVIDPDMILEGDNYRCYDNYCIEITNLYGLPHANFFDLDDVGKRFIITIKDCQNTQNSCWGYVNIEEKLIPEIGCPEDVTLYCGQNTEPVNTGFAELLSCEPNATIYYEDHIDDYGLCANPKSLITRVWFVDDNQGHVVSCNQYITIVPINVALVNWPEDIEIDSPLECGDVIDYPLLTSPDSTGYPEIAGLILPVGNKCMVSVIYADEIYPLCQGSYVIVRTWKVLNACLPLSATNPAVHPQAIKVIDTTSPLIYPCPSDLVVSTSPWACYTDVVDLPIPTKLYDQCSNVTLTVSIFGGGQITKQGSLQNGDLQIKAKNLVKGIHKIKYTAVDGCYNKRVCEFLLIVVDKVAPVVVTKQNVVVSLSAQGPSGDGNAKLFPSNLDNGSYDACTNIYLEIRRTDDAPACVNIGLNGYNNNITYNDNTPMLHPSDNLNDTDEGKYVKFCCDDINAELYDVDGDGILDRGYHRVLLRVWDDANGSTIFGDVVDGLADNFNESWSYVKVEDKLAPVLVCPVDITVACDVDLHVSTTRTSATGIDLSATGGSASAYATCDNIPVDYQDLPQLSPCNAGTITRRFFVQGRNDVFCVQRITVTAQNSFFNVTPPASSVINTTCSFNESLIKDSEKPVATGGPCDVIGENITIDTFYFEDGACKKWRVRYEYINWCTNELKGPYFRYYKYEDQIKPELTECEDTMIAVDNNCEAVLTVTNTGIDEGACSGGWLKWQVFVDLWADGSYDWEFSSFVSGGTNPADNNNNGVPDIFVAPTSSGQQLSITVPGVVYGNLSNHKVSWKVTDGCGNVTACDNNVMVVDKKDPTPYCISLSTALMVNGQVELWARDFDKGSFDNCTPKEDLLFTFNEANPVLTKLNSVHFFKGLGLNATEAEYNQGNAQKWVPDFKSSSKIFGCEEVGETVVKMSVWDGRFNTDFCEVTLTVVDNQGICETTTRFAGNITTPKGKPVDKVILEVDTDLPEYPITQVVSGSYLVSVPGFGMYEIGADKVDDYNVGVSTLDLVMIQRHILDIKKFTDPYNMVAADINNDDKINVIDLVELRRLILFVIQKFANNSSWEFMSASDTLSIANPYMYNEKIYVTAIPSHTISNDIFGIKIGDVNGSVNGILSGKSSEPRTINKIYLLTEEQIVQQGQIVEVAIRAKDFIDVSGFQFTSKFNGLSLQEIKPGVLPLENECYGIIDHNTMTVSFASSDILTHDEDQVLFTVIFKADRNGILSEMLAVNSELTTAESYTGSELLIGDIALEFRSKEMALEDGFALFQNVPNPYKYETEIRYYLPEAGEVKLTLMDVSGKVLMTKKLEGKKGENREKVYRNEINGSGIIIYQIEEGKHKAWKKMILID